MPDLDAIADTRNITAADDHFSDPEFPDSCAKCYMPVSEYRGAWIAGVKYCSDCAKEMRGYE